MMTSCLSVTKIKESNKLCKEQKIQKDEAHVPALLF